MYTNLSDLVSVSPVTLKKRTFALQEPFIIIDKI